MYIFFKAVVIIMCDFFQVIKNTFFLCKYFAAISVASSLQASSSLSQKKLPKWLRNVCITKNCVFNNLKRITHYYR